MSRIYIFQTILMLLSLSKINGDEKYILPTYVIPSHYTLNLVLDPKATTYNGSVEVTFSVTTLPRQLIKLHASPKTIKIDSTLLNNNHSCAVTEKDNNTEIVTLTCPVGSLQLKNSLTIHFRGGISTEETSGLFKMTYKEYGRDQVLLATLLESMNAREVFPCFDEPKLKSTFDILISHPKDYIALANTPVLKQFSIASNLIQTQFKTTPLMSTYLVAFVVSKFVSTTDNTIRGYDYRIFTRRDVKNCTSTAMTYGPALIDLLGNWTGIAYKDLGNGQLYQVVIPNADEGAMENWGLITYGENHLLDENEITSVPVKQNVILILAHELTHQWFGNYVTLEWWSNTWINEGLTEYFQYYITDQLEDKFETMEQFVVTEFQTLLETDVDPWATALSSDVSNEEESDYMFEHLIYVKGCSIIRMLRTIVGDTAFREGIQLYLLKHKYNNTRPSLLWDSFKVEIPLDLNKVMYNWIYKPGFPLVTATINKSTVTLTQDRFAFLPFKDTYFEKTQWYIPITYTNETEMDFNASTKGWLKPNSTFEIELKNNAWIIINIQQTGYYMVNYDNTLWQRIIDALKNERNVIHVLNRAQLIHDVFKTARAGRVSYRTAFHLLEYLRFETEYYPWVSAIEALSFLAGKLGDDVAERLLQLRLLYWINQAFPSKSANVGTRNIDKLKEVLILEKACSLGQRECIEYAKTTFQKYKTSYSLPDNNKRRIVFCYGFRNSSNPAKDYDFLVELYRNSSSIHQKNDILFALGCANDSELLIRYLAETVSENSTIKEPAAPLFEAVYTNSNIGVDVYFSFLENNLRNIKTKFKDTTLISALLLELCNRIRTNAQSKRFFKIVSKYSGVENDEIYRSLYVSTISMNWLWTQKYAAQIKTILQESQEE